MVRFTSTLLWLKNLISFNELTRSRKTTWLISMTMTHGLQPWSNPLYQVRSTSGIQAILEYIHECAQKMRSGKNDYNQVKGQTEVTIIVFWSYFLYLCVYKSIFNEIRFHAIFCMWMTLYWWWNVSSISMNQIIIMHGVKVLDWEIVFCYSTS